MAEGFSGGHSEQYRVALLNRYDIPVQWLNLSTGECDWNTFRTVQGAGSATVSSEGLSDVNWLTARLGISYHARYGSQAIDRQMMVAMVTGLEPQSDNLMKLSFLDKSSILMDTALSEFLGVPAGAVVTDVVRDLILSTGETKIAIPNSTETLRTAQVFDAGQSLMSVINSLLGTIGYTSLWVDGDGVFRSDKYIDPDRRVPVHNFQRGSAAIHSERIDDDLDLFDIPNTIVCVSTSDDEDGVMVASARNMRPDDPYSVPNRGPRTRYIEGVEASSQAVLQGIADRYLVSSSQVTWRQTLSHLWLNLAMDDAVISPNGKQFTVVERKQLLTPGALSQTTIRRMDTYYV